MGPNQSRITRLLTLLLSTVAPMTPALAQGFARVGAVNPNAMGTPPGGADRVLTIGSSIVVKERVRTTDAGSTQLLFPDQSTLNLGANSDMVIDEYFYDPAGKSGTMVASATKGVLRYVGGQISHTSGVTIMTPSAVLGIRGGIATLVLQRPECVAAIDPKLNGGAGCELVINHFGSLTIKNHVSQVTLKPGEATVVT
ncbi:MAG: FecR domain-containing protein, partial [Hyphomicrobiales bacterium]|nr:FecR domain-containing protein [Hyphomicrobiales bacterium]